MTKLHGGILGVIAAAWVGMLSLCMTSCELEPYVLPDTEIYMRNFIKKFGLIGDGQDFNVAIKSRVQVVVGAQPRDITVLVRMGNRYYRVAQYMDVAGTIDIPLNLPKETDRLFVRIDDSVLIATPGEVLDTTPLTVSSPVVMADIPDEVPNLAWLLVGEDLGALDDFDFNDVVFRFESVTMNAAAIRYEADLADWEQVDHDDDFVLKAPRSRVDDPADGTVIRVTAMCAGGYLPIYLHFVDEEAHDYILRPSTSYVDLRTENPDYLVSATGPMAELHKWFGDNVPTRTTINTGENDGHTGKSVVIIVPETFSMHDYSVCFRAYDGLTSPTKDSNIAWPAEGSYNSQYNIKGFYITVNSLIDDGTVITAPTKGMAPQMFLIPDTSADGLWCWPHERTDILEVYPSFRDWVGGNDNQWYLATPRGTFCPR